jgi:hypothetical protein
MVLQILLRQIDFGSFLLVVARRIILAIFCPSCYIFNNGDSYSRLPSDIDQVVRLFCPVILVLVLLPVLIDYFNGCARACSIGIAAQKIMGESSLVFTGLWFGIYLGLPSKKCKIVS